MGMRSLPFFTLPPPSSCSSTLHLLPLLWYPKASRSFPLFLAQNLPFSEKKGIKSGLAPLAGWGLCSVLAAGKKAPVRQPKTWLEERRAAAFEKKFFQARLRSFPLMLSCPPFSLFHRWPVVFKGFLLRVERTEEVVG